VATAPTSISAFPDTRLRPWRVDATTTLSTVRSLVGIASWATPALSWRTFGFGVLDADPRPRLLTRLFGARDLALGLAARHPRAEVRRAALGIGIAVDAIDVVASVIAARQRASKASLVLVGGGAALLAILGIAALSADQDDASYEPVAPSA
jgi:hypothetical protein